MAEAAEGRVQGFTAWLDRPHVQLRDVLTHPAGKRRGQISKGWQQVLIKSLAAGRAEGYGRSIHDGCPRTDSAVPIAAEASARSGARISGTSAALAPVVQTFSVDQDCSSRFWMLDLSAHHAQPPWGNVRIMYIMSNIGRRPDHVALRVRNASDGAPALGFAQT